MRQSAVFTMSLPPAMMKKAEKVAKKQHMTRSEFIRTALRRYLEEIDMDEAIRIADEEFRSGKAKTLPPGGLVELMQS